MTIDDLIRQVRGQIAAKTILRQPHQEVIEKVRASCLANSHDPSEKQQKAVREATDALAPIVAELSELRSRHDELLTELARDEAAGRLSREFHPAAARPHYQENTMSRASISSEPRTYHERSEHHFLRDLYATQILGDLGAGERLLRLQHELAVDGRGMSQRDVTSGNAGAFLPPQYLLDFVG